MTTGISCYAPFSTTMRECVRRNYSPSFASGERSRDEIASGERSRDEIASET